MRINIKPNAVTATKGIQVAAMDSKTKKQRLDNLKIVYSLKKSLLEAKLAIDKLSNQLLKSEELI